MIHQIQTWHHLKYQGIQVVTSLGMGKWPVQKSSDLQLKKKGHFESTAKKIIMGNDQVNQMKKNH